MDLACVTWSSKPIGSQKNKKPYKLIEDSIFIFLNMNTDIIPRLYSSLVLISLELNTSKKENWSYTSRKNEKALLWISIFMSNSFQGFIFKKRFQTCWRVHNNDASIWKFQNTKKGEMLHSKNLLLGRNNLLMNVLPSFKKVRFLSMFWKTNIYKLFLLLNNLKMWNFH